MDTPDRMEIIAQDREAFEDIMPEIVELFEKQKEVLLSELDALRKTLVEDPVSISRVEGAIDNIKNFRII